MDEDKAMGKALLGYLIYDAFVGSDHKLACIWTRVWDVSFKTSNTQSLDMCQFHDQVQQKQPEQTNIEGPCPRSHSSSTAGEKQFLQ